MPHRRSKQKEASIYRRRKGSVRPPRDVSSGAAAERHQGGCTIYARIPAAIHSYRRDHLRALAQRVEVDAKEVRITGSKSALLRTLVAASSAKTAGFGVPSFVPKWRAGRDSNP